MKLSRVFLRALAGIVFSAAGLLAADAQPANAVAGTPPVYVPDYTHANDPLPDGVLAWDDLMKSVDAAADQPQAHFTFHFTNVAKIFDIALVTNILESTNVSGSPVVTNITAITNSFTPASVTILSVHPSCGCTTAQLPTLPWLLPPGTDGQIPITVNIAGKSGTLFKFVDVSTDKGIKRLNLRINILPQVTPTLSAADRALGMALAKVDRQAVFKNDCAACHAKPAQGKYGKALYDAACAICHEAPNRATMVPDLHAIKAATNDPFWQTWIAHGKPGSLMPAFSTSDGGPLTDMQIASLAAYLDQAIPSHVPPVGQ
jgi:mono/diheme cytochrome c family protein